MWPLNILFSVGLKSFEGKEYYVNFIDIVRGSNAPLSQDISLNTYSHHIPCHKDSKAAEEECLFENLTVPIFVFSTSSGWMVPYGFHISGPVTNKRGLMCNYVFSDSSVKHPGLFYMEASGSHVYSGYSVVIDICILLIKS